MNSQNYYSLKSLNTFAVDCSTDQLIEINTYADLNSLSNILSNNFYILGEGSNTLFTDKAAPTIIKMKMKGITLSETEDAFLVNVAAGENWHDLVCYCLDNGLNGLENLALIPGSVGAAPVQNIGAYGVEFADVCLSVEWFEFSSGETITLSKEQCQFCYRESVFKNSFKNKGLITFVTLCLPKTWQPTLKYQGLFELGESVSARDVFNQVICLRSAKLPEPKVFPNAGSFFKNPTISANNFQILQKQFGGIAHYDQKNGDVKLAAGWLIEHTGLKGLRQGNVGVHDKQALVLINYNQGTGKDIFELAQYIQQQVLKKFKVLLKPEVRIIAEQGEILLTDMSISSDRQWLN